MPRHVTRCPCVLAPRTNGTNDWLGTVIIPIGEMSGEEKWYPLERDVAHVKNEHVQKGKDPQGEIKIKCQFLSPVRTQHSSIRPCAISTRSAVLVLPLGVFLIGRTPTH